MSDGFEAIAEIWDQKAGEDGDYFHNHLVYPSLLKVLGSVDGVRALDLGCGSGASSRLLAKHGADVTGIDASKSLIDLAREREQRNPRGVRYDVTDAADLSIFDDASFDVVVANMSLMDIADAKSTIREVSRILRPSGRFVATLFHPCFQPPDSSSWVIEVADKWTQIGRKVWRYRDEYETRGPIFIDPPVESAQYHRSLSWYITMLIEAGMVVDAFDEPLPDATWEADEPDSYARHAAVPVIATLGARKLG